MGCIKHWKIFQILQIVLALQAHAIWLSLKNLLVLINTNLHSKSCYYLFFQLSPINNSCILLNS